MIPGARQLFELRWLYAACEEPPGKLETNDDFLAAFQNAFQDRGDRSYDEKTGILSWRGSGWRLRDMLAFVVNVNGDLDTDASIDWLISRGYPDKETTNGYVFDFLSDAKLALTLGTTKSFQELLVLQLDGMTWVVAEKWAVNLSRILSYQSVYGNLDVIAENWA